MPRYTEDQLVAIAYFYYIEGFTQEEVAARMNLSRIAVTRMLKRAREEDIVHVSIKRPLPSLYQLALSLERKYRLKAVRVVQTSASGEETMDAMGRAGAEFLTGFLRPGRRIGVAWSRTVSTILPHIRRPIKPVNCIINELAGTYLSPDVPYSVSWQLAEKLGVPLESIPVPVLVKTEQAKEIMLQEEMIRKALNHATLVDIALVGIGNIGNDSSLASAGFVTGEQIEEFKRMSAVGDILMRYFNSEGKHISMPFDSRIISLPWEQIKKLPFVVAMACGPSKIAAIRGALAGRIIHGLITDRRTAETLLSAGPETASRGKKKH